MKFLQIKEDKKYKKYIVQRITERKGDQFMLKPLLMRRDNRYNNK